MNRRNFFQVAAGTAAVAFQDHAIERVSAAAASTNGQEGRKMSPADEDFWIEVRNSFSIDRNIINFNNGYCSPSPRTVQDAMRRYLDYSDMGPWHTMVNVLERQVEMVRRQDRRGRRLRFRRGRHHPQLQRVARKRAVRHRSAARATRC